MTRYTIVEAAVEIIKEQDPLKRIELAGRTCYKSEDRITKDSAERFVSNLIRMNHTSVLEHARVQVPDYMHDEYLSGQYPVPYGYFDRLRKSDKYPADHTNMNARDFIAIGGTLDQLKKLELATDYLTVRFICDRGISHELVRERVFSFSQESTRYVNYKNRLLSFVRPVPFDANHYKLWESHCDISALHYLLMLSNGAKPEEARNVLPQSVKTELVMSGLICHWKSMLSRRLASDAHPQMRHLMNSLISHKDCPDELKTKGV